MSRAKTDLSIQNPILDKVTGYMVSRPTDHNRFERLDLLLELLKSSKQITETDLEEGRNRIFNIHNLECNIFRRR